MTSTIVDVVDGRDDLETIYAVIDKIEIGGRAPAVRHDYGRVTLDDVYFLQQDVDWLMDEISSHLLSLPNPDDPEFRFTTSIFKEPINRFQAVMIDICHPADP
jgi:hypothetical protein